MAEENPPEVKTSSASAAHSDLEELCTMPWIEMGAHCLNSGVSYTPESAERLIKVLKEHGITYAETLSALYDEQAEDYNRRILRIARKEANTFFKKYGEGKEPDIRPSEAKESGNLNHWMDHEHDRACLRSIGKIVNDAADKSGGDKLR